jgi:hypothetical protein
MENAIAQRAAVRVIGQPVEWHRQGTVPTGESLRCVRAEPAWTSIFRTTAVAPRLQSVGAAAHQVERFDRIDHLLTGALVEVEMLAPQSQAKLAGEDTRLIAHPRGIPRFALVHALVEHGAGHLAVMRPRAPVEIVRTDHGPYVVYDNYLGVHIHGRAAVVLDAVDSEAVPGGGPAYLDRLLSSDQARPPRWPVVVRESRDYCYHVQVWLGAHGIGNEVSNKRCSQVLVLDVDETTGAGKHFPVRMPDASLTERREWVAAKYLNGVRTNSRWLRKRSRQLTTNELAGVVSPVDRHPHRTRQIENGAPSPSLPERVLDISSSGAADRDLHVVPRWTFAIDGGKVHRLRISRVPAAIVQAQSQIDAPDERHVTLRTSRVSDDHELLMVGSAATGTCIKQDLAASIGQLSDQLGVLTFALVQPARLRSPDKSEDQDTPFGKLGENSSNGGAGATEQFFGVSTEIGKVDLVAGPRLAEGVMQRREVARAVDERFDRIARRPIPNVGRTVAPLRIDEEPILNHRPRGPCHERQSVEDETRPLPQHASRIRHG